MNYLYETFYYGRNLYSWLLAVAVFFVTLVVVRIIKGLLSRRLTNLAAGTATTIDDLLAELLARTKFIFLLAISVYAGSLVLGPTLRISTWVRNITLVVFLFQVAIWGNHLVVYLVTQYVRLEEKDEATIRSVLTLVGRIVLWSLLVLVTLGNLGFDVTALVASLGIGGIAVALALQNILGDLFASVSIMLDRPFVVGDTIVVGDLRGTVEHIGMKSTRLRSGSGEQLIFSNTDLLKSRIWNYQQMYQRRVAFSFGITYQTAYEKLAAVPEMVRKIVEVQDPVRFDRAHFKGYGDSSLDFEVVYWVTTADYNTYMDIQQNINLELFKRFEEEGIEFAYPTRTVYLESTPGSE